MRRVVVTGLGMVSATGLRRRADLAQTAGRRIRGGRVENFDVSDLACQIAAQVPRGDGPDAFSPDDWMEPKEQRRVDDFIVYGDGGRNPGAARRRLGAQDLRGGDRDRRADRLRHRRPAAASTTPSITLHEKGPRRVSPFFIPGRLINLVERPGVDRP